MDQARAVKAVRACFDLEGGIVLLELCFDQSTKGGLCMAQHCGDRRTLSASGCIFSIEETAREDRQQLEKIRREAEERFRRQMEERRRNAISLGGDPGDVLGLSLALAVGDIQQPLTENCPRRELLRRWYDGDKQEVRYWKENMETLGRLQTCKTGEQVRIWADQTPESMCGLLFAASLLAETDAQVSAVFLPPWQERPDGTVVQNAGWGEVYPEEFGQFLPLEQPLTPAVLRMLSARWRTLKKENAPLRAVVNGRVCSVGEDFYDGYIRRALPEGREKIGVLIGNVLGQQLGIGDALLADRIRVLLARGEYRIVQEDPERFYGSVIEKV